MIYNMDAVKEMGSKPDNSEYLCNVIKKVSYFVGGGGKHTDGGLIQSQHPDV